MGRVRATFEFQGKTYPRAVPQPQRRTFGEVWKAPTPKDQSIFREINKRMLRMYDAAVTSNLTTDFPISVTSANAEILVSILGARGRMRRLDRDNPFAHGAIEAYIDNVGGEEPFRLEMKVGKKNADGEFIEEKDTNAEIEEAWAKAAEPENCCANRSLSRQEMDWQAIAALVRDGGIIYRHRRLYPKNRYGYAIEPIEIDRLDHYWNRPAQGTGNEIQFSIELDEWKAPVAYWILDRHPGDVYAWSNSPRYRTRIDAEEIIALFDIKTRAGQLVGMPRLASIIQRLHRIDQFDIAHCTAAIWSACKPFFFVQEFPTAQEYVPDFIKTAMDRASEFANESSGRNVGDKIADMEPATGEILPYGMKPIFSDPHFPIEAAGGFTKDNLRAAASGSGVPYHVLANDLEGVNFSSGRLGENAWHDLCKRLQSHLIVNYRIPHFRVWLKYAIMSGEVDQPISRLEELQDAAVFYGRRWPYINPYQDRQADALAIEMGVTSRSRIIAESDRGGDVEEVDAEIASDRKIDAAHKLDFTQNVSNPVLKKGAPGQLQPTPEELSDPADTPPAKNGKSHASGFCIECRSVVAEGDTRCYMCGSDGLHFPQRHRNGEHHESRFAP
jgi:lambda family phage portal protein